MSDRVHVAPAAEFGPGSREIVEVQGREVGVFNVDGEQYAILNHCLHQGGPVCEGRVRGKLVGEQTDPGERVEERFDEENPVVTCPWHGWEYELATGDHAGDDDISLPTFDVVVEDGDVYVEP